MFARSLPHLAVRARTRWRSTWRYVVVWVAILIALASCGVPAQNDSGGAMRERQWRVLPEFPLPARFGPVVVLAGLKLIVWGGDDHVDGALFDPGTNEWSVLPKSPLDRYRTGAAAVWTGSSILIWGGQHERGSAEMELNDGASFHLADSRWSTLAPSPLSGRTAPAAVWTGKEMLIVGGVHRTDAAAYDPVADRWRRIPSVPQQLDFTYTESFWTGTHMLLWDGRRGFTFDPATDTWRAIAKSPLTPRCCAAAVWTGERILIWGGSTATSVAQDVYLDDGASYDPVRDEWTPIRSSNLSARRLSATAWADQEMLIWGGDTEKGSASDGASFRMPHGQWQPLPESPLSPREGARAVAIGEEVLIWGGACPTSPPGGLVPCNDGAALVSSSEPAPIQSSPSVEPDPSPKQSVAVGNWRAKSVVYAAFGRHNNVELGQEAGIWLYDPDADESKLLVPGADGEDLFGPRFRNAKQISYFKGSGDGETYRTSIELLDIETGERRQLFGPTTTSLLGCDWRPDGEAFACIETDYNVDARHRVVVHGLDGSTRVVKVIGLPLGGHAYPDDEVEVTWSRDGRSLLVVDTHVNYVFDDAGQIGREIDTVHIFDMEGRDLIKPFRGTEAFWSPDEQFLYAREWDRSSPSRWFRTELATGGRRVLSMRSHGFAPTISPDGRFIAYQYDGNFVTGKADGGRNVLYVYDLDSDINRRVADPYEYPIWLRPGVLAATRVEECRAGTPGCGVEGWRGQGAWSIPVDGTDARPLKLGSTLFGSVDALIYE
jgi:WD40 repeat protein